jgi:hypothetical protein
VEQAIDAERLIGNFEDSVFLIPSGSGPGCGSACRCRRVQSLLENFRIPCHLGAERAGFKPIAIFHVRCVANLP